MDLTEAMFAEREPYRIECEELIRNLTNTTVYVGKWTHFGQFSVVLLRWLGAETVYVYVSIGRNTCSNVVFVCERNDIERKEI